MVRDVIVGMPLSAAFSWSTTSVLRLVVFDIPVHVDYAVGVVRIDRLSPRQSIRPSWDGP